MALLCLFPSLSTLPLALSLPLSRPIYSFCSAAFHFVLYYLLFVVVVVVPLLLLQFFFSSSVVAIVKNAMLELHLRSFTWSKCNHSAILASCRHTRTIVLLLFERVKKVNGQKHRNKLSPGLKIDLQFLFPTQRNGMARFLILQMLSH